MELRNHGFGHIFSIVINEGCNELFRHFLELNACVLLRTMKDSQLKIGLIIFLNVS